MCNVYFLEAHSFRARVRESKEKKDYRPFSYIYYISVGTEKKSNTSILILKDSVNIIGISMRRCAAFLLLRVQRNDTYYR